MEIIYQDEVHFQITTSVTRTWAPKGKQPKIKSKPGKANVPYSGYVSPSTGRLVMTEVSWFTYETVIASIRDYIKEMNTSFKKHLLIMDNASWHRKAARLILELDEYKDIRDVLDIDFLPPYSPDLNPIERVWRITRREKTHNTYFDSKQNLKETLDEYFAEFSVTNDKLSSLCQSKHK